jgi:hypothetical protein
MTSDRTSEIRRLIDRSSFATPSARKVRSRTPQHVIDRVLAAVTIRPAQDVRDEPLLRSLTSPQGRSSNASTTQRSSTMATSRRTSKTAAQAASKVLRDGRTGKASKTAAGSALSQRAPKKGK